MGIRHKATQSKQIPRFYGGGKDFTRVLLGTGNKVAMIVGASWGLCKAEKIKRSSFILFIKREAFFEDDWSIKIIFLRVRNFKSMCPCFKTYQGFKGGPGSPGAPGDPGIKGSPGQGGDTGLMGDTGPTGESGSGGLPGTDGVTGSRGSVGKQGEFGGPVSMSSQK